MDFPVSTGSFVPVLPFLLIASRSRHHYNYRSMFYRTDNIGHLSGKGVPGKHPENQCRNSDYWNID